MATTVMQGALHVRRKFYVGLGLFVTLIVLVGFWPSYFEAVVSGAVDRPLVIHFHAVVYVGWLAIFIAQTVFAATGRVALHQQLGTFAMGYGVLMIVAGLAAAFGMFAIRVNAGELEQAQGSLVGPLLDMLVFAPIFAAAVYYRRVPDLHKRFMIVATTSLLIAAVARMQFLGTPRSLWLVFLIWISPILLAMVYDFRRQRLVHPIYLAGIVVLALESPITRLAIRETETWKDLSGWLARAISG